MMSSTNEEDPFLQVQQDVLSALQIARPLFASYLRIRSISKSPDSPELVSARTDLQSALINLTEDLEDLHDSVSAVESDPASFGLSAPELARRKQLVQEMGGEIEDMREELAKKLLDSDPPHDRGKGKGKARNVNNDLPDPSSFAIRDGATAGEDEDEYVQFERQQQLQMMQDQDEMVDGVFMTVGNLRRQADDMGRELEEQHEMLEYVDTQTERVGRRLQTGMARMSHVIRSNEDKYSSWCIGLLIMVLCILLVLLLVL